MALIRWEPVPSRLFTSLWDTPTAALPAARRFAPATDIVESDTHYILRADLPGVKEEDIAVELDGDVLSISGQRSARSESREGGYSRVERTSGSFRRSIRLPQGIDASAIEANVDRGVLEVTVPKPVAASPQRIAVTVGDAPRPASAGDAVENGAHGDSAPEAPGAPEAQETAADHGSGADSAQPIAA